MVGAEERFDRPPGGRARFDGDERQAPVGLRAEPGVDENQRLVDQRMMDEVLCARRVRAQTDVIAPQPHALDQQHAAVRVEIDADPVQAAQRLAHHRRSPGRRDRIGERQREVCGRAGLDRPRQAAQLGDQRPRALQEADRLRREPYPAPVGLDEREPDGVLQRPDPLAHCRLREPQPRRRLGHGAESFQRDQRVDTVPHIPIRTGY